MKIQAKKEFDTHYRESKKTGGGPTPAFPKEVYKLVADVIPVSVNPLGNEFDDNSMEQLPLCDVYHEPDYDEAQPSGISVYSQDQSVEQELSQGNLF